MKRIIPLILLVITVALGAWAQNNPNRLIVIEKSGLYKGYLCERVDSMIFTQIEGRVAADVDFKEFKTGETGDTIMLAITMTEECQSYKIAVIPNNRMAFLNDEAKLASYIDSNEATRYYYGFTNAEMTGFDFEFQAKSDYTIATVGYDRYGIACGTSTATFTTPAPAIVGNPYVEATVDEVSQTSFTITFTPNADVASYSMCSFEEGTVQQQFDMFGPWMGFASIAEMVYAWGIQQTGTYTNTWTSMSAGTNYEVFIAIKDVNGNFAELLCVPVTTTSFGGEGLAEVEIEIGDFGGDADTGYYQEVTVTANDEASLFHMVLIEANTYETEWTEESILGYLTSPTNPYNPWDTYWDLYKEDCGYWNVDPDTRYYVFAIAKNIKDEWGPLAKCEFTTPSAEQPAAVAKKQPARILKGTTCGTARPVVPANFRPATKGIILK